ncbi:MAG: hypothetical protein OXG85_01140 [Chloroflexi bacterium]|nr:hypothetical protein [Chloroflexota bacterium]
MRKLCCCLREHRCFIIVVTLLTLVMTFPTIVYVFRTDVFVLPTGGSTDVYIKLWDIWYGGQVLSGKADRYYTDLIYYPEGVSLARHTIFLVYGALVNALQLLLPLSNAFNLAYLLNIASCALAAYIYFVWLFEDKWIALFGAVVFGFSPFVTGHPHWPNIGWTAPLPLVIYFFHRGVVERRRGLVVIAGLLAGLSHDASWYFYVVVLIALGLVVIGLSASRWRDITYWRQIALLVAAVVLSSALGAIPLLQDRGALEEASQYYGDRDTRGRGLDLASFFVNPRHPILGPFADAVLPMRDDSSDNAHSYLGVLPLALTAYGLATRAYRRKMLPWLGLCLTFIALHLGSHLRINGISYEYIYLPKHYLDSWLPVVFKLFSWLHFFMPGVTLSLAALAGFGLAALRSHIPAVARPGFMLLLIAIVALEYYVPTRMAFSDPFSQTSFISERLAWVDWLKQELGDIRLIMLPFERKNPKLYLYYQTLTGFPQTEGAISRTPDSAYDYLRANPVTRIWLEQRPTNCALQSPVEYLEGLTQLIEDGFSHVVHHRGLHYWERQDETFRYVDAAYSDDYVSIYRLTDMLESCPSGDDA